MSNKRTPPSPDALTRPERSAEVRGARKVLEQVKERGCFCCLRRDRATEGWDMALCGLSPPANFMGPTCKFDPDWDRLYSPENIA